MGVTKTDIYSDEHNKLAVLLKAIAHPARLAILQHLINRQSCICNDLVDELGLAQATISQHLKELKNIGILKGTIEGKSICYCIEESIWRAIQDKLHHFFNQPVTVKTCC